MDADGAVQGADGRETVWRELERAFASESWDERFLALAALDRCASIAVPETPPERVTELLQLALEDPHPDVRARALVAWARIEPGVALPAERVGASAAALLPRERAALVRALSVFASEVDASAHLSTLAQLARDRDSDVARAARQTLFAPQRVAAGVGAAERAELWRDLRRIGAERVELALLWSRAAPETDVLAQLLGEATNRAERAELAALAAPSAGARGAWGGWHDWIDGWFGAPWYGRQELFRTRAAGDGELAQRLIALAHAIEANAVAELPQGVASDLGLTAGSGAGPELAPEPELVPTSVPEPAEAARLLRDVAADGWGAERALAEALALVTESGSAELVAILSGLGPRVASWSAAPAPASPQNLAHLAWRSASTPAARKAVLEELAGAVFHGRDDGAAGVLLEALRSEDATSAGRAYRALASARDTDRFAAPLIAAWRDLDGAARLDRLVDLPRTPAFADLRVDLVQLGRDPGRARALAAEHLSAFGPDAATFAVLEKWFLEALGESESRADSSTVADRSAAALLRALSALNAEGAESIARRTLSELVEPNGYETRTAETVVALLGASVEGRAALREHFDGVLHEPPVDVATAIAECAIVLAPEHPPAAVFLRERWPDIPLDLEGRALDALSRADSSAIDFLRAMAESPVVEVSLRARATEAAARRAAAEWLASLAEAPEVPAEVRRAALLGLGRRAAEEVVQSALSRLANAFLQPGRALDAAARVDPATQDSNRLVHEALRLALARVPNLPDDMLDLALAGPARSALAQLDKRLAGESLERADLRWRGELALAARMAHEQRLGAWRRRAEAWRFDARLLLALARVAESSEPEVAALLARDAWSGLLGESDGRPPEAFEARLFMLRLAYAAGDRAQLRACARDLLRARDARELGEERWLAIASALGIAPGELRAQLNEWR